MKNLINKQIGKGKLIKALCFALLMLVIANKVNAQLSGMQSAYYQNQYLFNPAMAGMEKGLNLNIGYQQQWTTVQGGPKLQSFTADYNAGNNVGLGLNVNSDNAGLINRTRAMATYAYHLPLSQNGDKLNFGLSVGINDTYIDYSKLVGDQGDVSVQNFNQRSVYVDGDFGMSYTSNKFNIQAALPNMKSLFFNSEGSNLEVDRSTFYTAASYKIAMTNDYNNKFLLEPKVAFRGVKGFDNIVDLGAKMDMLDYNINFMGMYHSNKSATMAFGYDTDVFGFLISYTLNTGPLSLYASNTFEFGVKLKLFK